MTRTTTRTLRTAFAAFLALLFVALPIAAGSQTEIPSILPNSGTALPSAYPATQFTVFCNNPTPTTSPVNLVPGSYAVTVTGSCHYWDGPNCGWTYDFVASRCDTGAIALFPCSLQWGFGYVMVNGKCATTNGGLLVPQGVGPASAIFVDHSDGYGDNTGSFTVTMTLVST
jgi:hypothetical protein